jgi:hypothetical protein
MACRTCASAQSSALPSSPASVAEATDPESITPTVDPSASCVRSALSLTVHAMDELSNLQDAHLAYDCVENLVAPACATDSEELQTTRIELSALMRLINTELHHRTESADTAIKSVRDALSRCGAE